MLVDPNTSNYMGDQRSWEALKYVAKRAKKRGGKKKKNFQFKNQFDQKYIYWSVGNNPSPKYKKGQPKFVIAKKTTLSYKLMKS